LQSISTIGPDIAKSVFQVHGVDAAGEVIVALLGRAVTRRSTIISNAADDILEIRSALVETLEKSIRAFSTRCTSVDDYHMSLPRIEPGSINHT
jgi:hypothetical protein